MKESGDKKCGGFYLCSEFAPGGLGLICVPVDLGLLRGCRLLRPRVSNDVAGTFFFSKYIALKKRRAINEQKFEIQET